MRELVDWIAIDTNNTHVHVDSIGAKAVVATIGVENPDYNPHAGCNLGV